MNHWRRLNLQIEDWVGGRGRVGKYWRRGRLIMANSVHSLVGIVFSPLISYLVIQRGSLRLWGELVAILVVVQLGAHIVGWGHKGYLVRAFSQQPAEVGRLWWENVATRGRVGVLFLLFLLWWGGEQLGLAVFWWGVGLLWYQAQDSLVVYRQRFALAAGVELTGLIGLFLLIWWWPWALTVRDLAWLWALFVCLKGVCLGWGLWEGVPRGWWRGYNGRYWRLALPFFLMGFAGMIQSRIDLYAVNYYLAAEEVAQYQILINYLLYVQALANFILQPFVKVLYRLPLPAVIKIAGWLGLAGMGLTGPALWFLQWILPRWYQFELTSGLLWWGGVYIVPIYFYLPLIYLVYKNKQEYFVIGVTASSALLNLMLNIWLTPQKGLEGALMATAIANLFMFALYAGWAWQKRDEKGIQDE
ncbi:MAG TPA: polysaccharide biosynthesis C-terminal domain-containing protein [Anaerolineae bacterium]|nr:polysaccharide biosynthesis C-terminal domain-containing protein [Anaerolineae bacterium]